MHSSEQVDPRTEAERYQDAVRYGLCMLCGEPRLVKVERDQDGHPTAMHGSCPNGHWDW